MALPVSPRSDVPPVTAPPTLEELWAEYDRHLKEMLPLEIKVRLLAKNKEAEGKEAERQARMARWQEVVAKGRRAFRPGGGGGRVSLQAGQRRQMPCRRMEVPSTGV